MTTIDSFIADSNEAQNHDNLFQLYLVAMERIGFNHVFFSLLNQHPEFNQPSTPGFDDNNPAGLVTFYRLSQHNEQSPTLEKIRIHTDSFSLPGRDKPSSGKFKLFRQAQQATPDANTNSPPLNQNEIVTGENNTLFQPINIDQETLDTASLLSHHFYICFCRLMTQESNRHFNCLSSREQEVLHWLAQGHTKIEVSEKLHISQHTVDYHVRKILHKLDARNITAAAVTAINRQLIIL